MVWQSAGLMDLLGSSCDMYKGKNVFSGIKFRRPVVLKREIRSELLRT